MRIGAHIHTSGGLEQAAAYAASVGCECVQVFAKAPQAWNAPRRAPGDVAAFREALDSLGIGPLFTHASYLINLGSEDDVLWAKSTAGLADELVRGAELGAAGVVLHMGTEFGHERASQAARVADGVAAAWEQASIEGVGPRVLLENSAGAGRSYGHDLEQLCDALAACRSRGAPVGLCLDTCHGFAAGWDLRTSDAWAALCDGLEACGVLADVTLVHANDCKGGLGEHRDRHEWVGDGFMGQKAFAAMFAESRLRDVPVVVEMPGELPVKDEENVRRLRLLRAAAGADAGPDR